MSLYLPFLVLGLGLGSVFALSGVGMVVLYRATGVLFLAGGAIGALAAFSAWSLLNTAGIDVWVSAAIAVAGSGVLTGLYGRFLGPRLAAREPAVKATASLGLMLVLLGVMSIGWGAETYSLRLPSTAATVELGPVYVNGTQITSLVLAVLVTVGISVFLNRTRIGTAMRGLADDRDVAAMLGVPVRRVEAVAWMGSGVLFGVSGILLSNLIGLDITGLTFLVVSGLAAALVARLRSLPLTLAAGLGIGVLQSLLTPVLAVSAYRSVTPFVVAIVMVMVLASRTPSTVRV